jgi:tRNA dimethylallyltransferase
MDAAERIAPPLVVVAGATATGKTGLAIRLAEWLATEGRAAEVISADSRQVYRGLDIGTAKATAEDRARVAHHGLDLVEPDVPFSVADFTRHAREVLDELGRRNGVAILAGGTGLYLRAVARGLDTAALPSDPEMRARIEAALGADGLEPAVARLRAIAPALAATIDTRNPRRVGRALEIAELRGDGPLPEPVGYPGPLAWIGLRVEPERHTRWILERARAQFAAGLVEEARALRERFDPGLPAFSAIGYRESWAVLDGTLTREAAIELDAARNVAFSRRQRTWFRAEPGIGWIDVGASSPDEAARAMVRPLLEATAVRPRS